MTKIDRGYKVLKPKGGAPIKAWVNGVQVEDKAQEQLIQTAQLPFIYKHLAVMPDVHWGMGSTVGSVIPTRGAIIPAAVGVDIGCGMVAARLNLTASDLPDNLKNMRSTIEAAVPHGRSNNGGVGDCGAWSSMEIPEPVGLAWSTGIGKGYQEIADRTPRIAKWGDPVKHLGTLGTGNHFIELCLDEQDRVWVMLHSGSRGIGNRIGSHFINVAKKEMERHFINLPNRDLAYLPEGTENFDDYWRAVGWAQGYARTNRAIMLTHTLFAVSNVLGRELDIEGEAINCHHNYVSREHHYGENVFVTRKGAVRARKGDLGIIPGAMGRRSYIVEGVGNPESFHSCSHGAGRLMSRKAAREQFSIEDHVKATDGVECRKDEGVLDETPGAYKDIDTVMEAQQTLVTPLHTLRAVLCVKG